MARDPAWADLVSGSGGASLSPWTMATRGPTGRGRTLTAYRRGAQVTPVPDGSWTSRRTSPSTPWTHDEVTDAAGGPARPRGRRATPGPHSLARRPPGYLAALDRSSAAAALTDPDGLGDFLWVLHRGAPEVTGSALHGTVGGGALPDAARPPRASPCSPRGLPPAAADPPAEVVVTGTAHAGDRGRRARRRRRHQRHTEGHAPSSDVVGRDGSTSGSSRAPSDGDVDVLVVTAGPTRGQRRGARGAGPARSRRGGSGRTASSTRTTGRPSTSRCATGAVPAEPLRRRRGAAADALGGAAELPSARADRRSS